jgi:hypothetical protein
VSRRPWRIGAPRITEGEVNTLVTRARTDLAEILDGVLDNEAGLARIYAAHGQQPPARAAAAAPDEEDGQVRAVCERIAMLETTLAQAAKPGGPSIRAAMYLEMARGFLFELRSGLASRDLSAEDAFRLLGTVRHDLEEADRTLRSQQRLPLPPPVLAGTGEMRELTSEMTGQLAVLDEQVMRLFGHSGDPAAVPVPHH